MQYHEITHIKMSPDIYDGENCDQIKPQWIQGVEKEGDVVIEDIITLDCKKFPAGTRIIVEVPCCHECTMDIEMAKNNICECGFDWNEWIDHEFQ